MKKMSSLHGQIHLHIYFSTETLASYRVVVQGPGPGPRYGHVMALVGQRYVMAIGGNDGSYHVVFVFALVSCIFM